MRRAARIDDNQPQIVTALRAAGADVQSLAAVGKGVPDLLVAYGNANYLLEVKDGSKKPSARKLTPDEARWHALWRGPKAIVETPLQALLAVGVEQGRAEQIADAFNF